MNMRRMYGAFGVVMVCATAVSLSPSSAFASAPGPVAGVVMHATADARWSAWLGCWRPESMDGVAPPAHVICVLPGVDAGVSIATIANGRIVSEQVVVADGSRRAVNEGGCSGFESATWSQDGRRVFMKSELNCGSDINRTSSGVLALVSTASYVDVQTVEVAGERAARTVRYVALRESDIPSVVKSRLVSEPIARETARLRASSQLDVEDVVEATRVVGSAAVEGLLVARRAGFELNAERLRAMTNAGVQPSTVDVMIALTYPEHFEVAEESPRVYAGATGWDADERVRGIDDRSRNACFSRLSAYPAAYDGYRYDPYGYRYSRCGYNSFYSPYGYDSYGWGYGAGPVVVAQPSERADEVKGVAVKGKGYTRRGDSDGNGTTGTARPRAEPTTRPTSTGGTGSVKSGDTGGSSGSGSTSTSTGRTAKPRNGGGN